MSITVRPVRALLSAPRQSALWSMLAYGASGEPFADRADRPENIVTIVYSKAKCPAAEAAFAKVAIKVAGARGARRGAAASAGSPTRAARDRSRAASSAGEPAP